MFQTILKTFKVFYSTIFIFKIYLFWRIWGTPRPPPIENFMKIIFFFKILFLCTFMNETAPGFPMWPFEWMRRSTPLAQVLKGQVTVSTCCQRFHYCCCPEGEYMSTAVASCVKQADTGSLKHIYISSLVI